MTPPTLDCGGLVARILYEGGLSLGALAARLADPRTGERPAPETVCRWRAGANRPRPAAGAALVRVARELGIEVVAAPGRDGDHMTKRMQSEHAQRRARILALDSAGTAVGEIAKREGMTYMATWSTLARAGRRPLGSVPKAELECVEIKPLLDRVRSPLGLGLSLARLHEEIRRWAISHSRRPVALPTLKNWSRGEPCRPGGPVTTFLAFARDKGLL